MKLGVIGTGHVGLVVAAALAELGHEIHCTDANTELLNNLEKGILPFFEPGLKELFERNRKRIHCHSNIQAVVAPSTALFLAVGTPETTEGTSNLDALWKALQEVCATASEKKHLILKSTVPAGTAHRAKNLIKEHSQIAHSIISNPEFLRQGEAIEDFLRPDRIVVGHSTLEEREVMEKIYEPLLKNSSPKILFMDNVSAELVKYSANSFLALKISFINEMALLCERLGANIEQVREGLTSDHRINPHFFTPGLGYGGSCFPKDVRALTETAKDLGFDLFTIESAEKVNNRQKDLFFEKIKTQMGSLHEKRIGVWGLSYKPGTDDLRRAPSIEILQKLYSEGAQVQAYDPVAMENAKQALKDQFTPCESKEAACEGADALLIFTEWPEFHTLQLEHLKTLMRGNLIVDGRNLFDVQKMKSLGFNYLSVGRVSSLKI